MTLRNRIKRLETLAATRPPDRGQEAREAAANDRVLQHPDGPALLNELETIVAGLGFQGMTQLRQQLIFNPRAREIACRLAEIRGGLG